MASPQAQNVPKAMLYHDPQSPWSAAVKIALEEKGYGEDEIDLKIVDLQKGENFSPTFLRLNPKGTVPTMIVPFENTLDSVTESRYKAVTDITAIVDLLDRSRTAISRTHTTSFAPAPSLSPATIALSELSKSITALLHSAPASPELLFLFNARDTPALRAAVPTLLPFLQGRYEALNKYLKENEASEIRVSEKTRAFWVEKKRTTEEVLRVVEAAGKEEEELGEEEKRARKEYFENTKAAWEVGLAVVLQKISKDLVGPYALGDQFSVADIHLSAWLAWLLKISGGSVTDTGPEAIRKIEKNVGGGFSLPRAFITPPSPAQDGSTDATTPTQPVPQAKLAIIWDAIKERPSWSKIYGGGK